MTVVAYLARRYPHTPPDGWAQRAREGRLVLDGAPAAPEAVVMAGQTLLWARPPWREPDAPLSFAVLFRDAHLLGVLKPAGLPTLPGGGFLEHTLLRVVRRSFPEASPLHRLGRGTTGLVLCARTQEAGRIVSSAWQRGEVRKFYRALISGYPRQERFSIDVPIGRLRRPPGSYPCHGTTPDGKSALSHVRVLEERESGSLVEVEIVTGRAHQVRIHLAWAGHPLLGDPFYGPGGVPIPGSTTGPGEGGYFLHSHRLMLRHPIDGQPLQLEAPPTPALRTASER
jgi:23S rRNA pseudouridine1911/1915/1917 synthase